MTEPCFDLELVTEQTVLTLEASQVLLAFEAPEPFVVEVSTGTDCCVIELEADGPVIELTQDETELEVVGDETVIEFEMGEPGPPGPPGSLLRYGEGAPDDSLGINGDSYIDELSGIFWERTAGAYVERLDLGAFVADAIAAHEDEENPHGAYTTPEEVAELIALRQQFFIGATGEEPAAVTGLPLLFFETGLTADPEDVVPSVIE